MLSKYPVVLYYSLISGALLTLTVSFILVVNHQTVRCEFAFMGTSKTTCTEAAKSCPVPAIDLDMRSVFMDASYHISCPWQTSTSVTSYIAVLASLSFLIFYILKFKSSQITRWVLANGLLSIVALLAVFSLMTVDIAAGHYDIKQSPIPGMEVTSNQQLMFVVNVLFIAFALVINVLMLLDYYKINYECKNHHRASHRAPSYHQHLNIEHDTNFL